MGSKGKGTLASGCKQNKLHYNPIYLQKYHFRIKRQKRHSKYFKYFGKSVYKLRITSTKL